MNERVTYTDTEVMDRQRAYDLTITDNFIEDTLEKRLSSKDMSWVVWVFVARALYYIGDSIRQHAIATTRVGNKNA